MSLESIRPSFNLPPIEKLDVGGGEIDVMDVAPQGVGQKRTVLLLPGMGAPLNAYGRALMELSGRGRRALSLKHRTENRPLRVSKEQRASLKDFTDDQIRKAEDISAIIAAKNIESEPLDLIAHSNGAIIATVFALLHPEKVKNILYFAPAGMIRDDNVAKLAGRGTLERVGKKIPESMSKILGIPIKRSMQDQSTWATKGAEVDDKALHKPEYAEIPMNEVSTYVRAVGDAGFAEHSGSNRILSFKETLGMGSADLIPHLKTLRERRIGVLVMSGVDDSLFPTKSIVESIPKDTVDGFLSVRGDHGTLAEHPEIYMNAAEDMLTKVEQVKRS